ncbi:MAG: ferredoxin [Paracoccaceae bacterium]|nr:ferredoxin [Paracoccaceae bacterium]
MRLAEIEAAAAETALDIFGLFDCSGDPDLPEFARRLLLLGPREPGFWAHVTDSPEFRDSAPDPLDRWSRRVVTELAEGFGGTAVFPFGGPPYAPFQRWALASGRAWPSPVGLLVHDRAGLWVSYRGALALPFEMDLPGPGARPCDTCAGRPCLTACPVSALTSAGYDLDRCHDHLDGPGQATCMSRGCDVRRSCPAGGEYGRVEAQSAFHMRHFHR